MMLLIASMNASGVHSLIVSIDCYFKHVDGF